MRCRWVFATVMTTAVVSVLAGGCSGSSQPVSTTTAGAGGEPSLTATQTVAPEAPSTGPAGGLVLPNPTGAEDFGSGVALAAVSADEVWLAAQTSEDQEDSEGNMGASLFRFRDGRWQEVEPNVPFWCEDQNVLWASGPAAVVATDGAIWTTTGEGLVRFVDDSAQFVTVGARGCVAFPGPDSGVWLSSDAGFVLATPQGAGPTVPLPRDLDAAIVWAAGPDGTVLVGGSSEEAIRAANPEAEDLTGGLGSSLRLWDGSSWQSIDPPDPQLRLYGVLVTDDGAAWAIRGNETENVSLTLSRYDNQQWTTIDPDVGSFLAFHAAPAGVACVLSHNERGGYPDLGRVSCYDSAGQTAGPATTMEVFEFRVAPDGAIWGATAAAGEGWDHIARLAEQLSTR